MGKSDQWPAVREILDELRRFANDELHDNLLPFWSGRVIDTVREGFVGGISQEGVPAVDSPKGLILNARLLWTFSAVYNYTGDRQYFDLAGRACNYIAARFADKTHGGYYWMVDAAGRALETKKQTYAQAFIIYAFAEYYRACGRREVLDEAAGLFEIIERRCSDRVYGGYFEAFSAQWEEIEDMRLSGKDMNEKKSMNTHLHLLEAYTLLCRVWDDRRVREQLRNLVTIFLEKIIDPGSFHQRLFFDEKWHPRSAMISYGHDIEASWLLHEAAGVLDDREMLARVGELCTGMASGVAGGINKLGGLVHERDESGWTDGEMEWWAQAEAVTGFLHAFGISTDLRFLEMARQVKDFILGYMVDRVNGEWFYRVDREGRPLPGYDKAGFWKCPYHNVRMCLEILRFNPPEQTIVSDSPEKGSQ